MNKNSFTIIELVMVIVIVTILAAIAIPRINLRRDAQRANCYGSIDAIRSALNNYYSKAAIAGTPAFPATISGADFLPYINENKLPRHPVGRNWNDYYSTQSNRTLYTLNSGYASANGACTGF
jgi:type II secretory pathway pseudopilin PulG